MTFRLRPRRTLRPRSGQASPPPLAECLLAATMADAAWRDSILGDLREELLMVERQRGRGVARRWYWRNALAIGAGRVVARLGRRPSSGFLTRAADLETHAGWGSGFTRDLRHAARTLLRRPGTSAVIIATLALAIASNSTSFAIMDAIALRPFRFPDVERLVLIASSDPNQGLIDRDSVAPADFRDWQRETRTVTDLAAAEWWDANLSGIDTPEQVAAFRVTASFFTTLGVTPARGRNFLPDEETPGNHRRVIIGDALWKRLFAADPGIVGRTVRFDGEPYEVVGVAPPGFAIPLGSQAWAPLAHSPADWTRRRGDDLMVIGRRAPGASFEHARAELGAINGRLQREHPATNATRPITVVSFTTGMSDGGASAFTGTMLAASLLLLLIACANIANLLLARGAERSQEVAMRLALGASRGRLVFQLMIEAGLLTGLAVLAAMPLAWVGLTLSRQSIPPAVVRFVPGWEYMRLSPPVFVSAAVFGFFATLLFALVPAFQSVKGDVADALRHSSRSTTAPRQRHWLRNTLAGAQVAITLALLFGSALLLSAADSAINGTLGFDKRNLLVARLVLPERPYAKGEVRRQFIDGVLDRVRTIPAVASASMVSNLPYGGNNSMREFHPDDTRLEQRDVRLVDYRRVSPAYLETMRIPLLSGRGLTGADRGGSQEVAVVSRLLAERYWPAKDPVGRKFRITPDGPEIMIVGVAGDVLHDWFQQRRYPTVYRPLAQDAPYALAFVVRTVGEPTSIAGDLRRAVSAQDPDQPIIALQSMAGIVEERSAGLTFIAAALGVVAAVALGLAVMGLYSLMAFLISRRTRELGVRMALGATRWQVIGLTTRQGMRITVGGLIAGGLASAALGRVMESTLFGIVSSSAWQLAGMVLIVASVSLLASYIPARRTAELDPTAALRSE